MFAIKSDIVWIFIFIQVSKCERRIQDGVNVKAEKPYVVYLVKAPLARVGYDYWLCGGALVSSEFVVTSAACILDVDFLYVIAGYNKYVTDANIELDPCTSKMKKKVIYTCYPHGYELKHEQLDVWSLIDIGVAKVESPYDFNDQSYRTICSYTPRMIPISYDARYQEPGTDAAVFGWGHKFEWRKKEDRANHNQEYLNYAPVMIIEKRECKMHYEEYGKMRQVIDTYMICSLDGGKLDDFGERVETPGKQEELSLVNGCARRKSLGFNQDEALEECEEDYEYDDTRREIKNSKHSSNNSTIDIRNKNNDNKRRAEPNRTTVSNRSGLTNSNTNRTASINRTASFKKPLRSNTTVLFNETARGTRRNGICQNDHGGPLVTWVGAHEILIGVASVFKVTEHFKCTGPYLYTSTQCNGAFLDCILAKTTFVRRSSDPGIVFNNSRRSFCRKSVDDESHPTVERHISWLNHPAGPADHEKDLKHGRNGPDVDQPASAPGLDEEIVNESETNVNLANKMNPPNKRYPLDAANNKYVTNENNDPDINENGAPNNKYVANDQFTPAVNMEANDNYRQYNIPASNRGPASYNGPAPNNKPAQNNWPALNHKSDQINYQATNNKPPLNRGSVQKYGPLQNNVPAQNYGPALNYKSDQINYQGTNNKPARNHGPVQKYGPAQNNGPARNYGPALNYKPDQMNYQATNNTPALNHGPIQKYGPLQNNGPALNYKPDQIHYQPTNIKPALNHGTVRKYGPTQNNGPAQNNRPATNNRPEPNNKYGTRQIEVTQNKEGKSLMRPLIPIHL